MAADSNPPAEESGPSYSVPHIQAFDGARYFLVHLEQMTRAADARAEELKAQGTDPDRASMVDAMERQALSQAVRVFCAMTMEGAVNLLGVMLLGEGPYYKELERESVRGKLKELFKVLPLPPAPELAEELLALVKDMHDARNDFVHPKPQEGSSQQREWRRRDYSSAAEAVNSTQRFLRCMMLLVHTRAGHFFPFPRMSR